MNKKNIITTIGFIILVAITILGFFATKYMVTKIEQDEISNLLIRSSTVASLIDYEKLSLLTGTESDVQNKYYLSIKKDLEDVHSINTDVRFVYILGQKNREQFFYVDAEPPESPDFSYPGQKYLDATENDKNKYDNSVSYTKGPYTDSWGTWFTAFSPIKDESGKILGMVGMDIYADRLLLRISIVGQATVVIFSLLFLAVLVVVILLRDNFTNK